MILFIKIKSTYFVIRIYLLWFLRQSLLQPFLVAYYYCNVWTFLTFHRINFGYFLKLIDCIISTINLFFYRFHFHLYFWILSKVLKLKDFWLFWIVCFGFQTNLINGWSNFYILWSNFYVLWSPRSIYQNLSRILPYLRLLLEILFHHIVLITLLAITINRYHINILSILLPNINRSVIRRVIDGFDLRWTSLSTLAILTIVVQFLLVKLDVWLVRPV